MGVGSILGNIGYVSGAIPSGHAEQVKKIPPAVLTDAEALAGEMQAAVMADVERREEAQRKKADGLDRPRLREPRAASADGEGGNARARSGYEVLADVLTLLQNGNLSRLSLNAKMAMLRDRARTEEQAKLVADYEAAIHAVVNAMDRLESLAHLLSGKADLLAMAEAELRDQQMDSALLALGSAEHADVIRQCEALRVKISQLRSEVTFLQGCVDEAKNLCIGLQNQVNALLSMSNGQGALLSGPALERDKSNIARLLRLLGFLADLLIRGAEERMHAQRAMLRMQQDIRTEKLRRLHIRFRRQMEEREKWQRIGYWTFFGMSIALIVISLCTGCFLMALVGVVLLVLDDVMDRLMGIRPIEELISLAIDAMIPHIQATLREIEKALVEIGVDQKSAHTISVFLLIIFAVILVILLALFMRVVGVIVKIMSAALRIVLSSMVQIAKRVIGKIIPQIIKKSTVELLKKFTRLYARLLQAMTRKLGLSTDVASRQIYAQYMMKASAGVGFVGTVAAGLLDIAAQTANVSAAETKAEMRLIFAELDVLDTMIADSLKQMQKIFEASQGMYVNASSAIREHTINISEVARAIGSARKV